MAAASRRAERRVIADHREFAVGEFAFVEPGEADDGTDRAVRTVQDAAAALIVLNVEDQSEDDGADVGPRTAPSPRCAAALATRFGSLSGTSLHLVGAA
jgi:hypothetical protein